VPLRYRLQLGPHHNLTSRMQKITARNLVAVEASPCHWAIPKQECAECVEGKPTKMKQKFRASLKLAETGDANDREAV
jgi:hypothetical protein